jgi:oligopeptide transport system substrate-binding protein
MRRLAGVLLLLLAACQTPPAEGPAAPASPSPTPVTLPTDQQTDREQRTTLRYAIGEPGAIVPHDAIDADSLVVVSALFEPLTTHDPGLTVVPAAAVRWRAQNDATEWAFILRRGATFHDGSPVTAEDFVYSWNLAAREGDAGYHLAAVEGYEAVASGAADSLTGLEADGEHVLRVRLRHPYADFPSVVAHPALAPVPRRAWEADPQAFAERPIGNGPFAMAEDRARGRFIRLTRADGWRDDDRPHVAEVLFQILAPDSAYLAFQQGRLDVSPLPPGALANAVEQFGESPDGYGGSGVLTGDLPILYYLGFDITQSPFDDVDVRRAVSLAIDAERIARETLEGNTTIARSAVPPAVPRARPRSCLTCRHDPERAAAVFEDRGIEQLELWFNRHGGHEEVARLVREDLAAVGVRVVFRTEEFGDYLQTLARGDAGLFRFGWALDYPTLDESLFPLFHSQSMPPGELAHNYGRYRSGEVDELLTAARATMDPDERRLLFLRAETIILRDQAIVPIMGYRHRVVVSDRLEGFVLNALGLPNIAEVRVRS